MSQPTFCLPGHLVLTVLALLCWGGGGGAQGWVGQWGLVLFCAPNMTPGYEGTTEFVLILAGVTPLAHGNYYERTLD